MAKKDVMYKLGVVLLTAATLVLLWLGLGYHSYSTSSINDGTENIIYNVKPGSGIKRLAQDLSSKGMISSPRLFELFVRLGGEADSIQAGVYAIKPGMTAQQFMLALATGDVLSYAFTVIEGWSLKQLLAELANAREMKKTLESPAQLVKLLGISHASAEGLFMPDTYFYQPGSSDLDFLRKAHKAMQSYLETKWPGRDKGLPYTSPYQALVMASIVEKETGVADERPQIANVFLRRLAIGMRLQTDPTVIYGLGDRYDGNLRKIDLLTDTPYNTYTRGGLPPTPIAMAGRGAIDAALHPAGAAALYFVATGKGDGRHVFTNTLEEHNKAVRSYLDERRRARLAEQKG